MGTRKNITIYKWNILCGNQYKNLRDLHALQTLFNLLFVSRNKENDTKFKIIIINCNKTRIIPVYYRIYSHSTNVTRCDKKCNFSIISNFRYESDIFDNEVNTLIIKLNFFDTQSNRSCLIGSKLGYFNFSLDSFCEVLHFLSKFSGYLYQI